MKKRVKKLLQVIIFVVVFIAVIFILTNVIAKIASTKATPQLNYSTLLHLIEDQLVDSVTIEEGDATNLVTVHLKSEAQYYYNNIDSQLYEVEVLDKSLLLDFLQEHRTISDDNISIKIVEDSSFSGGDIVSIILILLYFIFIVVIFLPNSLKEKILKTSSSSGQRKKIDFEKRTCESDVTFDDVAGLVEEKGELEEIIDFLKFPYSYLEMGAKLPKGVLLAGEPGTGKTLLAKAVANEAGVEFLAASGAEFVEVYVGTGAGRIRDLFESAREIAPCIVFIDEIDAFGQDRNKYNEGSSEYNQTLEQLLIELDGFNSSDNIIILAATNRLSSLDSALTRPGRFDRTINFSLPDLSEIESILKLHARNKKFMEDVNFKELAYNTSGYSGADLEGLLNEAAILAVRYRHTAISNADISEAFKKKIGLSKPNKIISKTEKCLTAYHESGHAIATKIYKPQTSLKEICIIPRGNAGGFTISDSTEDKMYYTSQEFRQEIIILLAGRAAESVKLGDVSTGPFNDLERATEIAQKMIIYYGMDSDIGPMSLAKTTEFIKEDLGISSKVSEILKDSEKAAEKLMIEYSELLEALKDILLEKETISGDEFEQLFKKYTNQKAKADNAEA